LGAEPNRAAGELPENWPPPNGVGANAPAPFVAVELPRYDAEPLAPPDARTESAAFTVSLLGSPHNRHAVTGFHVCHPTTLAAAAEPAATTATIITARVR